MDTTECPSSSLPQLQKKRIEPFIGSFERFKMLVTSQSGLKITPSNDTDYDVTCLQLSMMKIDKSV